MNHPATLLPLSNLLDGLHSHAQQGYIRVVRSGPLRLYTYTEQATWEGKWNAMTRAARGLIVDVEEGRIVALPFPKFFNLSENIDPVPSLPFSVHEKMDGSLIIAYFYDGAWHCATKGSFTSTQAQSGESLLNRLRLHLLPRDCTFLFELIGPSNKIVVPYPKDQLVLLGGYNLNGQELEQDFLKSVAYWQGIDMPSTYSIYPGLSSLVADAEVLPADEEGFVIRYSDGTRFKVKGAEYLRIHRLISQLTPLSVWGMMKDSPKLLETLRRELPEELWPEFDSIKVSLQCQLNDMLDRISLLHGATKHLSDKELGLSLMSLDPSLRKFIFPYRKASPGLREGVFQAIRPTGNILPGVVE